MATSKTRTLAVALAAAAFALFFALGRVVGAGADPGWLLTIESSWVDHGSLVAWWFTWFGYPYVLGPLCAALLVVAWRYPVWRARALFSVVMVVVCWQGADLFQHFFARPRRLDWVVRHETAFGYPSSHAAIAAGFYFLWAIFVFRSNLRGRAYLSGALAVVSVAIVWSRLALGAHYLTDLLGGVLLAVSLVSLGSAVLPINVFGAAGRRP